MLRIRGDRDSLITALMSHWLDQTLQLPATEARQTSSFSPLHSPLQRAATSQRRKRNDN